ncbi:MAG: hypothetical protein PPP56_02225 [Longimonas sp.]
MERFDKSRTHLVQQIRDLVLKPGKLFGFGACELLIPIRATLFAAKLRIEACFDSVLVLPECAKLTAVHKDCLFTVVGYSEVDLPEIYARYLIRFGPSLQFRLILRAENMLATIEDDLYLVGLRMWPANPERIFTAPVREAELALSDTNGRLAVNELEVALLLVWWPSTCPLPVGPPRVQGVEESMIDCLCGVRMQPLKACTHPALHRVAMQPYALLSDSTPVARRDTRPESTCPLTKAVNLWT